MEKFQYYQDKLSEMNKSDSSKKILIIADSHGKIIPTPFIKTKYIIITKFIRGLKWFDFFNSELCLKSLLSKRTFDKYLSESEGLILLKGTNSARIINSSKIIRQIEENVIFIRNYYPHFNQSEKISICLTFPCCKTSSRFPSTFSLNSNINSLNQKLINLSKQMHFNIIDCKIKNNHLANDLIHIHYRFQYFILNSIFDYVNHFAEISSTTTTTHINSKTRSISNKRTLSPSNDESKNTSKRR